ncbi:MAG: hypothetical protein ACOC33_00310 [bacterium]
MITGTTESKLEQLRTFSPSSDFFKRYKISTGNNDNGVIQSATNINTGIISYRIDQITFVTNTGTSITTFSFGASNICETGVTENNIYREDKSTFLIEPIKTETDLLLERQQLSVFENHYRMKGIENLTELINYGGGYFNIIENS